jgi:LDH2 family malate/lactate/ureidoglycolate dehydrogenase
VHDAAFSASAHGKIRVYKQRGQQLPAGWALDIAGMPTTDPAVAIDGLLRPIGEFKGANLAMIMGVLSSMLSGASDGTQLGDMYAGPRAGQDGHFVCALRVEAFRALQGAHRRGRARSLDRARAWFRQVYALAKRALCEREYRTQGIR